jgi:hypothetical protein
MSDAKLTIVNAIPIFCPVFAGSSLIGVSPACRSEDTPAVPKPYVAVQPNIPDLEVTRDQSSNVVLVNRRMIMYVLIVVVVQRTAHDEN